MRAEPATPRPMVAAPTGAETPSRQSPPMTTSARTATALILGDLKLAAGRHRPGLDVAVSANRGPSICFLAVVDVLTRMVDHGEAQRSTTTYRPGDGRPGGLLKHRRVT